MKMIGSPSATFFFADQTLKDDDVTEEITFFDVLTRLGFRANTEKKKKKNREPQLQLNLLCTQIPPGSY